MAAEEEEEKKNRPEDSDFKQQRLKAWQPILTPNWVILTFFTVGVVFLAIGVAVLVASDEVVEIVTGDYSGQSPSGSTCASNSSAIAQGLSTPSSCIFPQQITITKDMTQPIYVYYQLENFYQNHRRYVKSRSDTQLRAGSGSDLTTTTDCAPQASRNGNNIYPCGLIAWSVFNDTFYGDQTATKLGSVSLLRAGATSDVAWSGENIAWSSDVEKKFKQYSPAADETATSAKLVMPYNNYKYFVCSKSGVTCSCPTNGICNSTDQGMPSSTSKGCNPGKVSTTTCPTENRFADVGNEELIVWMRTSGLPTFRKLHRIIKTDLKKDDVITIYINNIFPVSAFSGQKKIVLSTTTWIGGKNSFLGWAYIVVAILCILLAMGFGIKQLVAPREIAKSSELEKQMHSGDGDD